MLQTSENIFLSVTSEFLSLQLLRASSRYIDGICGSEDNFFSRYLSQGIATTSLRRHHLQEILARLRRQSKMTHDQPSSIGLRDTLPNERAAGMEPGTSQTL